MAWGIFIPIVLFIVFGWIIKIISDNRVRQKLIEQGLVDEKVKNLYPDREVSQRLSSLKWGLVLVGIGLAILLGQLFNPEISDEMTVSGMFLFAGLGFLIYYIVAKKYYEQSKRQTENNSSEGVASGKLENRK